MLFSLPFSQCHSQRHSRCHEHTSNVIFDVILDVIVIVILNLDIIINVQCHYSVVLHVIINAILNVILNVIRPRWRRRLIALLLRQLGAGVGVGGRVGGGDLPPNAGVVPHAGRVPERVVEQSSAAGPVVAAGPEGLPSLGQVPGPTTSKYAVLPDARRRGGRMLAQNCRLVNRAIAVVPEHPAHQLVRKPLLLSAGPADCPPLRRRRP
jgi:hypothetical protein